MSDREGKLLNPADARMFRITHVDNVPWLLDHGLHCQSSTVRDPNFVPIGMASLIDKRSKHLVPIAPGGVLADYVPFYFTPWSMMLKNITTGYNGVTKRSNADIVIVGTRMSIVLANQLPVVFTDGHAYMRQTRYFADPAKLDQVDWAILRTRNFAKTDEDPDKSRRYQAEALVRAHVPIDAIGAIVCNAAPTGDRVQRWVNERGLGTRVAVQPTWYF